MLAWAEARDVRERAEVKREVGTTEGLDKWRMTLDFKLCKSDRSAGSQGQVSTRSRKAGSFLDAEK